MGSHEDQYRIYSDQYAVRYSGGSTDDGEEPVRQSYLPGLSGIHPYHAAAGAFVLGIFRSGQAFGSTRALGWNLSGEVASVIVFVLWGTAEMGDLVRGALISIPKHQYESSEALGFSKIQTYLYIIIPQTVRRLIPLSINLITRMIKTTSLVLMIGVVEMLKVAQQIIEANRMSSPNAAFGVFLVVFVLYFFACWPFSVLARVLEKKWN